MAKLVPSRKESGNVAHGQALTLVHISATHSKTQMIVIIACKKRPDREGQREASGATRKAQAIVLKHIGRDIAHQVVTLRIGLLEKIIIQDVRRES